MEWCKFLSNAPRPGGESTVIVTNGGGIGVLAADACEKYGVHLLDDMEVARGVIRLRLRRGYGRAALRLALRKRLIPDELANEALAEVAEEQYDAALECAVQRAIRRSPEFREEQRDRQRVLRYLVARGFSAASAADAVARAEREVEDAKEAHQ